MAEGIGKTERWARPLKAGPAGACGSPHRSRYWERIASIGRSLGPTTNQELSLRAPLAGPTALPLPVDGEPAEERDSALLLALSSSSSAGAPEAKTERHPLRPVPSRPIPSSPQRPRMEPLPSSCALPFKRFPRCYPQAPEGPREPLPPTPP